METVIRVGIIGFGYFGKKIHSKLYHPSLSGKVDCTVVCTHDYQEKILAEHNQRKLDWVFVATPNHTHYKIVKFLLLNGIDTFCEKPLTCSPAQATELSLLASSLRKKLYVDDVFNYRIESENIKFTKEEVNEVVWKKFGSFNDTVLNNLVWHDLYLLRSHAEGDIIVTESLRNMFECTRHNLCFSATVGDIKFPFKYDVTHEGSQTKKIGGVEFSKLMGNDALLDMIRTVLLEKCDFSANLKTAVWCVATIANLKMRLYPTVAVVGGGIFGTTASVALSHHGYNVILYEEKEDIHCCATGINQFRLHRGYHYPRSTETAMSSRNGEESFRKRFPKAVEDKNDHYYAISQTKSLTSPEEYISFMNELDLEYHTTLSTSKDFTIKLDEWITGTSLVVKVDESLINPHIMKKLAWDDLIGHDVDVRLLRRVTKSNLISYDAYVVATYSSLNDIITPTLDFQHELCEKVVVKLPEIYSGKSIVIMDGPFMCIDPYAESEYHLMGHVVHAIHHTSVGMKWSVPEPYLKVLNRGVITDMNVLKRITKYDRFISSAKAFFPGISQAEHVGSMFTVRTVLPNRDHDDARPSHVKRIFDDSDGNGIYIFSGKICTCVDVSEKVVAMMVETVPI